MEIRVFSLFVEVMLGEGNGNSPKSPRLDLATLRCWRVSRLTISAGMYRNFKVVASIHSYIFISIFHLIVIKITIIINLQKLHALTFFFRQIIISIYRIRFHWKFNRINRFDEVVRSHALNESVAFYRSVEYVYSMKSGTKHGSLIVSMVSFVSMFPRARWLVLMEKSAEREGQQVEGGEHPIRIRPCNVLAQ